jgi:hypothetical protein
VSQNVIELNGKRYDAITGAYLGKGDTPVVKSAAPHHPASAAHGRVIDGFIRPVAHKTPLKTEPAPKTVHAHPLSKPHTPEPAKSAPTAKLHHAGHAHLHKPGTDAKPHQPEHAKTLMRHYVKKPQVTMKPAIRPQAPAEVMARPASSLMRKRSVASVDPDRMERAAHIGKHKAVARFNSVAAALTPREYTGLHSHAAVPVIEVRATPAQHVSRPAVHTQRPVDIFESAIARATSHEESPHEPRRSRRHHRLVNTLAAVAAFVIIGGFIAYLNLPNIELHVASVQAGFHASMPAYAPTGYALKGGVKQNGGTVSLRFTSGDSAYTLTQQASDWNSQTLLDNTLALSGAHKTVERDGRTIYVYNSGNTTNAAWVTGQVRYDIAGNASLSSDEIANIAVSL